MSIFRNLLGPRTKKSAPTGSFVTSTVLPPLNVESALRIAAVFDAVRILSEDVASLPLHIYSGDNTNKERNDQIPLARILHKAPNEYQSAMDLREALTASLLLTGHAYSEIESDRRGEVAALHFIDPYRVSIHIGKTLQFKIDGKDFPSNKIFHIHGFSTDGVHGRAIAAQACESLELSRYLDIYGRRFFQSGGNLKGILKHEKHLSKEAHENLKGSFIDTYGSGPAKGFGVAVLEEGIDYMPIQSKPEESQLLELRKFQVNEVARWFRLPPHMLGDLERATHSNIEQQSLEYVKYTLRPWLVRIEQAISRQLLSGEFYCEHNLEGLLRADIKSRYDAYAVGRQWGWLSVNDIRRKENMEPVKEGDTRLEPMNYRIAGEIGEVKTV
ncbi:MAG: phage portal protein [Spirochaetaceae bacterium]|nr:phage portal protein [Spirochaetaceae bacterium]MCF7948538.1 phage portal protein [Spirochaetia bacterium]MCF7951016.1 phage portal protein [Spirochaetaceae bacterium]